MRKIGRVFLLVPFVLAGMGFVYSVAEARNRVSEATVYFKRVQVRTWKAMEAAEAEMKASGKVPEIPVVPFRPTMRADAYKVAKEAAAASAGVRRQDIKAVNEVATAPIFKGVDIEGANQTEGGGWRPPDTHGAVGIDHFVEVTNSHLDIYKKSDGSRVKSVSLASFFGYTNKALFDPRCVYDSSGKRWLVSAEAFQESTTVQFQFLAVSKTSDPTGEFFIFKADVDYKNNNDFWDYPQLGVNKDAVIFTANIFASGIFYTGSDVAVLDKAKLYSGSSLRVKLFAGLSGTIAPPIVVDSNNKIFLVAATSSGKVTMYTLTYPGGIPQISTSTITVDAYSAPPPAKQPGTTSTLDTLDGRFQNASTQLGNSLWQVHTIKGSSGLPTPRWYELNTATGMSTQSGTFSASSTSNDWNPSIVANTNSDVFVTWSSTDPNAGTNAQVRFSGRRITDPSGVIGGGTALFTSSTFYDPTSDQPERWGDYSAVTIDPSTPTNAWIVNEKINATTTWGTRIGNIGY